MVVVEFGIPVVPTEGFQADCATIVLVSQESFSGVRSESKSRPASPAGKQRSATRLNALASAAVVLADELSCIAEQITAAWAAGVRTLGSCCGHFKDYHNVVLTGDPEQPALAREHLPGWTLYQWQLVDVSCAVIGERVPA